MDAKFAFLGLLIVVAGLIVFAYTQEATRINGAFSKVPSADDDQEVVHDQPHDTQKVTKRSQPKVEDAEELSNLAAEDRAVEVAKDYVKSLSGYKDQAGRNIQILSVAGMSCDGCWLVQLTFRRDRLYYPDDEEHITVNLRLKDWEVQSYTFG